MIAVRNRLLPAALLVLALVTFAVAFVPQPVVGSIINAMRFCAAILVTLLYGPVAWRALRARPPLPRHYLGLGIFLTWGALGLGSAWLLAGQVFGFATSVMESGITSLFASMSIFGAVLHLLAPMPEKPNFSGRMFLLLIIGGALIAGAMIGSAPLWGGCDRFAEVLRMFEPSWCDSDQPAAPPVL